MLSSLQAAATGNNGDNQEGWESDSMLETDIDESPKEEQDGTEQVDFMDSERIKETRKIGGGATESTKKKGKSNQVLGEDEAVWGCKSPMGPHHSDEQGDLQFGNNCILREPFLAAQALFCAKFCLSRTGASRK